MPSGRPRKPTALRILDGDTRKVGANRHAEQIAGAFVVTAGAPPIPSALSRIPVKPRADLPAELAYRLERERMIIKAAREHWDYLMLVLAPNGLLSTCDQGVLLGLAMAFGEMAYADGNQRVHAINSYRMMSDRVGLNAATRAGFTKAPSAMDDLEAALCG